MFDMVFPLCKYPLNTKNLFAKSITVKQFMGRVNLVSTMPNTERICKKKVTVGPLVDAELK